MTEIFFPNTKKSLMLDEDDAKLWFDKKWSLSRGYFIRGLGRSTVSLHREIMKAGKGVIIDHIDRNTFNNTKDNLRLSNSSLNAVNKTKTKLRCSSKYKGVSWDKAAGKYLAQIRVLGKKCYLGQFVKQEDAARAYDKRAAEVFGSHAVLNFA